MTTVRTQPKAAEAAGQFAGASPPKAASRENEKEARRVVAGKGGRTASGCAAHAGSRVALGRGREAASQREGGMKEGGGTMDTVALETSPVTFAASPRKGLRAAYERWGGDQPDDASSAWFNQCRLLPKTPK